MRRNIGLLAAMAAMMGGGYAAHATIPTSKSKDQVIVVDNFKRPSFGRSKFVGAGDANPYKHIRTPKVNQRQKRKGWAQCPHTRPKKNRR